MRHPDHHHSSQRFESTVLGQQYLGLMMGFLFALYNSPPKLIDCSLELCRNFSIIPVAAVLAMASSEYGIAYLDLPGNRIDWSATGKGKNKILLKGSHFHDIGPMATLVISALCLLSFLVIVVQATRQGSKCFPKTSPIWSAMYSMILFFAFDIANRVTHELGKVLDPAYVAIDIPMGTLSSFADACLMTYLWKSSVVDPAIAGLLARFVMGSAVVIFALISVASKGTQIWNVVNQIDGNGNKVSGDEVIDTWYSVSRVISMDLNSAAVGMLLLFAIGFSLLSVNFVRRLSKTHLPKRLGSIVGILATVFLARNAVMFVFALLYTHYNHVASLGVQLVYMVFYGLLSVIVYACTVMRAATQQNEDDVGNEARHGQVLVTSDPIGDMTQPEKSQFIISQKSYNNSHGTYPCQE